MGQQMLLFIVALLCGFCHAPEHAYETLLDHDEVSRAQLCPEADERLRIASAPEPDEIPGVAWAWDEERHEWRKWREYGACATCGSPTWRYAHEPVEHECRRCQHAFIEQMARDLGTEPALLTKADREALLVGHPRQVPSTLRYNHLRFSDYEVPNTQLFEHLPGPRYGKARPRILFGQALLPARCAKMPDVSAEAD